MVERFLAKEEVAGSKPVSRSSRYPVFEPVSAPAAFHHIWLCFGFSSGPSYDQATITWSWVRCAHAALLDACACHSGG